MSHAWDRIGPILRDRAYGMLDSDPEILLETDAASALPADVYFARLIGLDGEIVQDGWQLPGGTAPTPILRRPLMRRMTFVDGPIEPTTLNAAEYQLQSGSAITPVSAEVATVPGVEPNPLTFITRVGWLRYRRVLKRPSASQEGTE